MQNLEHLITKKIKSTYLRRLSSPIIYLIFLAIVWFYTPMHALMHPLEVGQSDDLTVLAQNDNRYINVELGNLSFTGYTLNRFGFCQGYYYYTMRDDQCYLVILSPRTCEEGLPNIEKIKVRARLESAPQTYEQLAEKLAEDLGWTKQGLTKQVSHYIISEPGFGTLTSSLLLFVYFVSGGYALISIVLFLIYAFVPVLSPTSRQLGLYGKRSVLLAQAEEELATLPQLATEDMFITEHYFIMTSPYGNAIVPIKEILWIYKYSTLHKILWYHFSISYTLHISANKHLYIHCPKNTKSDIDGIIDYLAEANHDILVGFSEENRLKVQAIQGKPLHVERLLAWKKKK